jgi:hypothetical protein
MILESMFALALAGGAPLAETCVPVPAAGHTGASQLKWYIDGEAITVEGKKYSKYGLPRVLAKGDVELLAPYQGGFVYAEAGSDQREVVYVLTHIVGCEFQPYQLEA